MGVGYGNVAVYGSQTYKQEGIISADDSRHFKMLLDLFPLEQLLIDEED